MPRAKHSRTAKQHKAKADFRQLIVTLNASNNEVTKIEGIGATGKRYAVSETEFAKLAGDDELEHFAEALEGAYAAGIRDGIDDALGSDLSAETEETGPHQTPQETVGEQILRFGIRRFILRRAVRRSAVLKHLQAAHNGMHAARGG